VLSSRRYAMYIFMSSTCTRKHCEPTGGFRFLKVVDRRFGALRIFSARDFIVFADRIFLSRPSNSP